MVTKFHQSPLERILPLLLFLFFTFALYLPLGSLFLTGTSSVVSNLPLDLLGNALRLSALQAFLSTLLSALVGITLSIIYVDSSLKLARVFWNLSLLCFSLPTLIVCLALIGFWGRSGWIGRFLLSMGFEFYGWFGILSAHLFLNFAVFFRSVSERLLNEGRLLERAALRLGASRWQTFRWVTLPKIMPSIRSSSLLVFIYCFTSFLTVLLLGGGPRFTTLEILIYQSIRLDNDLPLAGILSAIQILFCLTAFYLIGGRRTLPKLGEHSEFRVYEPRTPLGRISITSFLFIVLIFLAGPLVQLIFEGLNHLMTLGNWELITVTGTGLLLAVTVATVGLILGLCIAHTIVHSYPTRFGRFLRVSTSLPMVFSSILLSMALFQYYGQLPLMRETLVGPFIIQLLTILPLAVRYLITGFERIPVTLLKAGLSLGASRWKRFLWIELPLLKSSFKLVFGLSICLSLGEVGSLLMFAVGGDGTLPLWIFRQMGRYHFDNAASGAVLLIAVYLVFFTFLGKDENSV